MPFLNRSQQHTRMRRLINELTHYTNSYAIHNLLYMSQNREQERRRHTLTLPNPNSNRVRELDPSPPRTNSWDAQAHVFVEKAIKDVTILIAAGPDDTSETCVICITNFDEKDTLRMLRCEHKFHKDCIDNWFVRKLQCPVCRTYIPSTDDNRPYLRDFICVQHLLERYPALADPRWMPPSVLQQFSFSSPQQDFSIQEANTPSEAEIAALEMTPAASTSQPDSSEAQVVSTTVKRRNSSGEENVPAKRSSSASSPHGYNLRRSGNNEPDGSTGGSSSMPL